MKEDWEISRHELEEFSDRERRSRPQLQTFIPRFMKPRSNTLVKVRLVKLPQKRYVPYSSEVYGTEETDTEQNPRPHDMSKYCFSTQDSQTRINTMSGKNKNLTISLKETKPKEDSGELKSKERLERDERMPTITVEDNQLSGILRTEDLKELKYNINGSERSQSPSPSPSQSRSPSPELMPLDENQQIVDTKTSLKAMGNPSQININSNSVIANSVRATDRKPSKVLKNLISIDDRSRVMNQLETSKHQSEKGSAFGRSKSILKTSTKGRADSKSKSREDSRKVQFSKLRTVVYFKLMKGEVQHKQESNQNNRIDRYLRDHHED